MADHNAEDDRIHVTGTDTERVVEQLREAYAEMRRFYSRRSVYHSKPDDDKLWRKIVPDILSYGISPQHFVKTSFEYYLYELKKPVAWVQSIASSKAVKRYLERQRDRAAELDLLLRLQLDTITVQLANGREMEDIIRDPTLELNAVVRYAFALQTGALDLIDELREPAEFDLKFEPQYRRFMSQVTGRAESSYGTE